MFRKLNFAGLIVGLLCLASHAQVAHVLDTSFTGGAHDAYLPSAAYPLGGGTFFGVEPLPASGALAIGPREGGMTINQKNGVVYCSDGVLVTFDNNPLHLPFTPPAPTPLPAPAPALGTGGPITGMALDTLGGILWMTDGPTLQGFTPLPPFLPVTPLYNLPFATPGTVGLSGLDIDNATGTLWGCDPFGNIFNFTTAAVPIGLQPVSVVPLAAGSGGLGGLCVNRTNGAGAVTPPFCSTQQVGYHICVTDGPLIYDALVLINPPIATPASAGTSARGLAMSCDHQIMKGAVICPSTFTFPVIGMTKAAHRGPGGGNAFRLVGGPPLTTALLLYDFCPIPGGLFIPASGEVLWLNPFSITFNFAPFTTNAVGSVTSPIGFSFAAAGIQYSMQWAIYDPLAPLGYCLSDGMCWTIGVQ